MRHDSNPFDDLAPDGDMDTVLGEAGMSPDGGETPTAYRVDDWARRLELMNEAARLHPGNQLDQAIATAQLQYRDLEKVAPFVRTVPPSASKAIQGGQATISSGQFSPGVVFWTAPDDAEAQPITVTVCNLGNTGTANYPTATGGGSNLSYRGWCDILVGVRGYSKTIRIDATRGQSVTVWGSSVYVSLGMDAAQTGFAAGTMPLAAWITWGAKQSATPVYRTAYIDSLANGSASNIIVPEFAQRVLFYRDDETMAAQLRLQNTAANNRGVVTVAANTNLTEPIALGADVYAVNVLHSAGAGNMNADLMFELCL